MNKGKDTHTLAFWNCKMPDMWSGNVWEQVYQEKKKDGTKYKDFYYYGL